MEFKVSEWFFNKSTENKKSSTKVRIFLFVAGAGLEPTTFGL
jgi:hypothetical protein